jgi:ketosteroid isomerase-like protein
VSHATADASYFDDIAAQERVAGGDALRAYAAGLAGQIPPHAFEMVDPLVQLAGDAAVLTFRYHPAAPDGTPLPAWRATTVYRREEGEWRLLHAHWSMQKQA